MLTQLVTVVVRAEQSEQSIQEMRTFEVELFLDGSVRGQVAVYNKSRVVPGVTPSD